MLTICPGDLNDCKKAYGFLDDVVSDYDKFNNCFNVLRRDVYLLVNKRIHTATDFSRQSYFFQIKYKKINQDLIDDFVNAALVESHLYLIHGEASLEVLLALRFKAHKEDWEEIYFRAVNNKQNNILELKQKQKVKKNKWRTRHINRMSLSPAPTITSITDEIRSYYKFSDKTKPKTKKSTYEYWDKIKIDNEDEDEIDDDDLLNYHL